MKIWEIIQAAVFRLADAEDARLAAEVLLAHVLKCTKEEIFKNEDLELMPADEVLFSGFFDRFIAGEPIAYITGKKEFYGLDFFVNKDVLIPRPETEHLIDEVLAFASRNRFELNIIDVGTGSGCIAVTLAKRLLNAKITAVDISEIALEVARKNASNHNVAGRIAFIHSDLFEKVVGSFDVVVANLPYIGREKFNSITREVLEYEPHVALFGGDDGLRLYEKLFQQMNARKKLPLLFIGEFGFLQGDKIRQLLDQYFGTCSIAILKDYASIERMFMVVSPAHV
jgi:release factor glutamine methyltransferase